jgi:hypothetical protein
MIYRLCMILILIFIFACPSLLNAEISYREANSWANKSLTEDVDKVFHAFIGGSIAYGIQHFDYNKHVAAATPITIGLIKEMTDKNFDKYDAISWAIGGVIGAYAAPWITINMGDDSLTINIQKNF